MSLADALRNAGLNERVAKVLHMGRYVAAGEKETMTMGSHTVTIVVGIGSLPNFA